MTSSAAAADRDRRTAMRYGRRRRRYRYPDRWHRDYMILRASRHLTENWTGYYWDFRRETKQKMAPIWEAMRVAHAGQEEEV